MAERSSFADDPLLVRQQFVRSGHLQQVLLNLIVNGMDAMNDTPELERHIIVQTKPGNAGEIEVMVMDQGHGISQEKLPRLFDSFFTTKRDGMGLGLSIARSIIKAHHGRIWVENNPVGGAAFRFTVPVASMKDDWNTIFPK